MVKFIQLRSQFKKAFNKEIGSAGVFIDPFDGKLYKRGDERRVYIC